jgi:uncharacterized membrane protein YesL
MLTKISATTAAVTAIANLLTLFSVVSWTGGQVAGINLAIVALATLIHAWFNPKIPIGVTE